MINDLLDLAKIEAGTVEFHPTPLPLMRFLQTLVETLQPVAREKTIDLQVQEKGIEVIVHADADKLTQVLTNLIHNACKFTPAGGTVRVELSLLERLVQVCVADTGCGIAQELQETFHISLRNSIVPFVEYRTTGHWFRVGDREVFCRTPSRPNMGGKQGTQRQPILLHGPQPLRYTRRLCFDQNV